VDPTPTQYRPDVWTGPRHEGQEPYTPGVVPVADQQQTKRNFVAAKIEIIATLLIWGITDLYFFIRYGGPATISTQIGNWMASGRVLGFLIGGLMVGLVTHLYRMMPADTSTGQHLYVIAGMIVGGILLWFITPQ